LAAHKWHNQNKLKLELLENRNLNIPPAL